VKKCIKCVQKQPVEEPKRRDRQGLTDIGLHDIDDEEEFIKMINDKYNTVDREGGGNTKD